jgi:uncharacterized membrane protein
MEKLVNNIIIVVLGILMIALSIQLCVHGHYGVAIGCGMVASVFGAIFYMESRR